MEKIGRKFIYDFDLLSLIWLRVTTSLKVSSGNSVGKGPPGPGLLVTASSLVLNAVILAALGILVLADHRAFAHVLLATLGLSFGIRQFSLNFGKRLVRHLEQVRVGVIVTTGLPLSHRDRLASVEQAVVLAPC
jgi:hypothetical protein